MTLLDRYLAREILLPFAAGLVFLVQILLATQILAQADVLFGAGVSVLDLGAVALDLVPHFLGYVLPVAFLLGCTVGTGGWRRTASWWRSARLGCSPARLARVPIVLGVVLSALALWVGLVLEPAGLRDARQRVNDLIRKNVTNDVHAGIFYEDLPDLTLYAEGSQGGRWRHVLISDRTDPAAPLLALAEAGGIEPAGPARRCGSCWSGGRSTARSWARTSTWPRTTAAPPSRSAWGRRSPTATASSARPSRCTRPTSWRWRGAPPIRPRRAVRGPSSTGASPARSRCSPSASWRCQSPPRAAAAAPSATRRRW